MTKIDGLEIVMTKQMQKMIDKELKKRFEELKLELATRYEELLNMRNMEADQFNDGFNDARAGKLETDHPHYDFDTDNWRLGYAWGMFEPMKEKLEAQETIAEIQKMALDALNARIAKLEAEHKKAFDLVRKLRMYCIWAKWDNPDTEDEFSEFDEEVCEWLSKFMEREA